MLTENKFYDLILWIQEFRCDASYCIFPPVVKRLGDCKHYVLKIRSETDMLLFNVEFSLLLNGEDHRLCVFENRVPNEIFGPKRNQVTGEGKRLRNEKL